MTDADLVISTLHKHLTRTRLTVGDEAGLQHQVEAAFKGAGLPYRREYRLSPRDRPDFMLRGTVVELKLHPTATTIHRQLARYAEHAEVCSLVLVAMRPVAGLPAVVGGKPIRQFAVWSYCL